MCSSSFNTDSKANLKKKRDKNIKAKFNSTKNETGQHEHKCHAEKITESQTVGTDW